MYINSYNKPLKILNMKNSIHSCTVKSESVCQILALHNLELATATSLEVFDSSARMCYALMLIISARRALKTCTWSWTCTILMHARALPSVARRYRSSQGLPVGVKPQRSKLPGLRVARAATEWGREFVCLSACVYVLTGLSQAAAAVEGRERAGMT